MQTAKNITAQRQENGSDQAAETAKIKVLINGALGRMGQIAAKAVNQQASLQLVGQTGREYNLHQAIIDSEAEVVIDFTEPGSVYQNTLTIIDAGARPVIGTSGLSAAQIAELTAYAAKLARGGIIAPNFSVAAILMMKYAAALAAYMREAEIIEMHHEKKIDSPSGTAIRSAELIAAARKANSALAQTETCNISAAQKIQAAELAAAEMASASVATVETLSGARGALHHSIPIHSIRLPGVLAHQQIIFGNTGETLTLTHNSLDRSCFIPGIAFACAKVMTLNHLVYGLEEII